MTQKLQPLGFTLAELLIALMILGEIATFTIPKILTSQQNQQYNAGAKDVIAMVSAAHLQHMQTGNLSTSTVLKDLTQYMNYVSVDTSGFIDGLPTSGTAQLQCANANPCLMLHNGMKLFVWPGSFGTTTSYASLYLDPEGYSSGSQTSLYIMLYYNGRIKTYGDQVAAYNPTWFSW